MLRGARHALLMWEDGRLAELVWPHLHVVLQEPVADLGQVGRLADAVHADKDNRVRLAPRARGVHLRVQCRGMVVMAKFPIPQAARCTTCESCRALLTAISYQRGNELKANLC